VVNEIGNVFQKPSFLHTFHKVHSLREMALGALFGRRASPADDNTQSSNDNVAYEKKLSYDAEAAGGILPVADSGSDASITIGKQIEMEANNAIKYRTCSWQKVCRYNTTDVSAAIGRQY
jgi:hypothetical protein